MSRKSALKPHCIMGNDYYVTNEHLLLENGHAQPAGEVFGYDGLTRQYYTIATTYQ